LGIPTYDLKEGFALSPTSNLMVFWVKETLKEKKYILQRVFCIIVTLGVFAFVSVCIEGQIQVWNIQ